MVGWYFCVFRQSDGGRAPATPDSKAAARLAEWQTGSGGITWLDALVHSGKALNLGGVGYPLRYTLMFCHLAPVLADGPPGARTPWDRDPGDFVSSQWKGTTTIFQDVIGRCEPDDWLVIEVWDES